MDPVALSPDLLDQLLSRQRRLETMPDHVAVDGFFQQILRVADRFVPSEGGSLVIDDPAIKVGAGNNPGRNELVFVACYGERADELIGTRLQANHGMVGRTYLTGQPLVASVSGGDAQLLGLATSTPCREPRSLLSVPIQLGRSTCGAIELVNRREREEFDDQDVELLTILAGYLSTSLQNILDANRYRELAKRDDLTGLYNDRYFNQALSTEIERAERQGSELGLVFLDLDHFKEINDKHGHLVGSRALREVGIILVTGGMPRDVIVARYGGDEFVIIAPGHELEATVALAEGIRQRIERSVFRIDHDVEGSGVLLVGGVITASIGVASYRTFAWTAERLVTRKNALIRTADQAMYRAKAEGKNRVCRGLHQLSNQPTPALQRG